MQSNETRAPAAAKLKAAVQNYDWGVRGGGESCLVARMAGAEVSEDKPYAELWMGTHPKAPSLVLDEGWNGMHLGEFLRQNECFNGSKTAGLFGGDLPYLFKCLSVAKALSIQAHPDKTLAKLLHAKDSSNYPDDNHKPELACAVTDFEGLCGFRKLEEIMENIRAVPELQQLIGQDVVDMIESSLRQEIPSRAEALKQAFNKVMSTSEDQMQERAKRMIDRLTSTKTRRDVEELVLRINQQFPLDVGLFNIFFLNHVRLRPGQALFLGPNLPHAYLSGDCMEIMATSDNVVRAGFTPKFKDVTTLCSMLDYERSGPAVIMEGESREGMRVYAPPGNGFPEFALKRIDLSSNAVDLGSSVAPRILICVEGQAQLRANSDRKNESLVATDILMSSSSVIVLAANCSAGLEPSTGLLAVTHIASLIAALQVNQLSSLWPAAILVWRLEVGNVHDFIKA